ncbi:MAG: hypothetical protein QUS14_12515 [Pyrinomonadaceae bacterium]|nr:hypothetical protein [Pyrinomonadaceae bacterium]
MNKRIVTLSLFLFAFASAIASPAHAQVYNSNAGGWNTGYGTVYGSFGLAQATQNIYNTTQMQIQRLTARQAMIKQFGLAAVEKAEREARSGKPAAASSSKAAGPAVQPPPVVRNYGKFTPDASVNTAKQIADAVGETPEEKKLLMLIATSTKAAFETEAAAKGWSNNIAGALTFFIVSNATIYHGAEPSDESVETLYQALNESIDQIPEFGKISNREKQGFYNMLLGFAGIPLMTYMEGVEKKDEATIEVARQLAGGMTEMIMKTGPENIRVEDGKIVFKQ